MTTGPAPRVSVVLAVQDGAPWVGEAVRSVLGQTAARPGADRHRRRLHRRHAADARRASPTRGCAWRAGRAWASRASLNEGVSLARAAADRASRRRRRGAAGAAGAPASRSSTRIRRSACWAPAPARSTRRSRRGPRGAAGRRRRDPPRADPRNVFVHSSVMVRRQALVARRRLRRRVSGGPGLRPLDAAGRASPGWPTCRSRWWCGGCCRAASRPSARTTACAPRRACAGARCASGAYPPWCALFALRPALALALPAPAPAGAGGGCTPARDAERAADPAGARLHPAGRRPAARPGAGAGLRARGWRFDRGGAARRRRCSSDSASAGVETCGGCATDRLDPLTVLKLVRLIRRHGVRPRALARQGRRPARPAGRPPRRRAGRSHVSRPALRALRRARPRRLPGPRASPGRLARAWSSTSRAPSRTRGWRWGCSGPVRAASWSTAWTSARLAAPRSTAGTRAPRWGWIRPRLVVGMRRALRRGQAARRPAARGGAGPARPPPWRSSAAGPRRPRLRALASELGLGPRVVFAGEVPEAARCLAAFDVFAAPSRKEGLPLAVLEAMALGLPVVASDIPAHREVLGPISEGLVAGTPEAFAARLGALLSDADQRGAPGRREPHAGAERIRRPVDARRAGGRLQRGAGPVVP